MNSTAPYATNKVDMMPRRRAVVPDLLQALLQGLKTKFGWLHSRSLSHSKKYETFLFISLLGIRNRIKSH